MDTRSECRSKGRKQVLVAIAVAEVARSHWAAFSNLIRPIFALLQYITLCIIASKIAGFMCSRYKIQIPLSPLMTPQLAATGEGELQVASRATS